MINWIILKETQKIPSKVLEREETRPVRPPTHYARHYRTIFSQHRYSQCKPNMTRILSAKRRKKEKKTIRAVCILFPQMYIKNPFVKLVCLFMLFCSQRVKYELFVDPEQSSWANDWKRKFVSNVKIAYALSLICDVQHIDIGRDSMLAFQSNLFYCWSNDDTEANMQIIAIHLLFVFLSIELGFSHFIIRQIKYKL